MSDLKHLTGSSHATTTAPPQQALALLADVGTYSEWFGSVVRESRTDAAPSDGAPGRGAVTLEVSVGPLKRSFTFELEIHRDGPDTVRLRRIPSDGSDRETFSVTWRVPDGGPPTRLEANLEAHLDVPPFVPAAAVGNTLASGLVRAAAGRLDKLAP